MDLTEKLISDIKQMKEDRNAVILAHNYQVPEELAEKAYLPIERMLNIA